MTTTSFTIADQKLLDGEQYTVSHNTDLSQDGTASVLIENPTSSGTEMVITHSNVTHEGETECAIFTNVSNISGGTSEDIEQDNVGSGNTSDMTSTTDASYDTDDEHSRVVYTGTGVRTLFDGYKMVIQPGNNIVVELTNPSSNNDQIGIILTWVEKPK